MYAVADTIYAGTDDGVRISTIAVTAGGNGGSGGRGGISESVDHEVREDNIRVVVVAAGN